MTVYITLDQVIKLHRAILESSGGSQGIRDQGGLESALSQPKMEAFAQELYPTIAEKAAMLGFLLIANHPFIDGNKRIGHAAMEAFLMLNDHEIEADVDEQETIILQVAAGQMNKEYFTEWVKRVIKPL